MTEKNKLRYKDILKTPDTSSVSKDIIGKVLGGDTMKAELVAGFKKVLKDRRNA